MSAVQKTSAWKTADESIRCHFLPQFLFSPGLGHFSKTKSILYTVFPHKATSVGILSSLHICCDDLKFQGSFFFYWYTRNFPLLLTW